MVIGENTLRIFREACSGIDWNIKELSDSEFTDLASKYSNKPFDRNNHEQVSELAKLIKQRILEVLYGEEEYARTFFNKIYKTYYLLTTIEKKNDSLFCNIAKELFQQFGNEDKILNPDLDQLKVSLLCLRDHQCIYDSKICQDHIDRIDGKLGSTCNAICFLQGRYNIVYLIKDGGISVSSNELTRIGNDLSEQMQSFGGSCFIRGIYNYLYENQQYNERFCRFLFPISVLTHGEKLKASQPWGYLFNLALKYPHNGRVKKSKKQEAWENIIETSTHLVSLLEIEPYSAYENISIQGNDVIKLLTNFGLLESNFKIPQIRYSDIPTLIQGLFAWTQELENDSWEIQYTDINYFANECLALFQSFNSTTFNLSYLQNLTKEQLSKEKLDFILEILTHSSAPNENFVSPLDHIEVNAFQKPFIRINKDELLIPLPSFSAYTLIEAFMSYYRKKIPNYDDHLGNKLEDLIRINLSNHNVSFKFGNYTNSERQDGEIDIAIELEGQIIFMEVKKKSFTRKSRSGYTEEILIDMSKSLLESQIQAFKHQYSLLKDGQIQLENGDTICLNGKKVEHISITLFDYGTMQDRMLVSKYLETHLLFKFIEDGDNRAKLEDLNKTRSKFKDICEKISSYDATLMDHCFFNCRVLSIPQLLLLLDNVSNTSDLKDELRKTKSITFNSTDWYYEYKKMMNLRLKPAEGVTA